MGVPMVGLIALDRDVVVEDDLHHVLGGHVSLATTRIRLEEVGSVEALKALERDLESAASLLPAQAGRVVAVACTSAVTVIGSDTIAERVRTGRPDAVVVNPLDGMREALARFGARRVALVSPYSGEISQMMADWLGSHGFAVERTRQLAGAFPTYADIPGEMIVETAAEVAEGLDAIVLPCTDMRAMPVIEEIEAVTEIPVLTSNQALAWSITRALDAKVPGPGRVFDA